MTTFLPATMTERIRDLMDQNHISQSELAEKLNMTNSALSRFLNGKTSKISDDAILNWRRSSAYPQTFSMEPQRSRTA